MMLRLCRLLLKVCSVLLQPKNRVVSVMLRLCPVRYSGLTTAAHCNQDGKQKAPQLYNEAFCISMWKHRLQCTVM